MDWLFNTMDFTTKGIDWPKWLVILYIITEACFVLAFFAIPLQIYLVYRKRRTYYKAWVLLLFSSLTITLAISHLINIIVFWWPIYTLMALIHMIGTVLSVTTSVVLPSLIRFFLNIVSTEEVLKKNNELLILIASIRISEQAALDKALKISKELDNAKENLLRMNKKTDLSDHIIEIRSCLERIRNA